MATAKNVSTENKINIVTNTENSVTVTQPSIQSVEITTGPQGKKGDTGAQGIPGDSASTGSLVATGSVSNNVLTFTKGDNSTFTLTVDTGSTVAAAGNDQEIQFNNNSSFSGDSKFKFVYDSSSLEQGNGVNASGSYSHAEGWFTTAAGQASHAEGRSNTVTGDYSHAEGYNNNVTGLYSHVAGESNILTGRGTYVNGRYNSGSSNWSTVVGRENILTVDSDYSFVGGYQSKISSSFYGFAFGEGAFVYGNHGFAIGQETSASFYGFALGSKTKASFAARAAGRETTANSRYTHTEGVNTQGGGEFQHLFTSSLTEPTTNWGDPGSDINNGDVWYNTSNNLLYAYTGSGTVSQGFVSQNDEAVTVPFFITSSGTLTTATFGSGDVFPAASSSAVLAARFNYDQAYYSHAEGSHNKTYGRASHAEGYFNQAGGYASHVEGYFTRTGKINEYGAAPQGESGSYAHAEGWQTQANGIASHAEGFASRARGNYSHAQGKVTIAEGDYQHTMGHYNETNTTSLVIIGNGTSSGNKKNLIEFNLDGIVINEPITGSTFNIEANTVISDSSTTELLRVTQTGTGDAIRIEDSVNPDSTPTVITNVGNVLIGTGSGAPSNNKLYIKGGDAGSLTPTSGNTVVIESNTTNYLGLYAPDASFSGIVMGSPSDAFGSFIRWSHDDGRLRIGAAKTNHSIEFSVGNKSATSMQLTPDATSTSNYNATLTVTGSIITDNIYVSSNISASGIIQSSGTETAGTTRTLFTTASMVYSGSNVTQITQSFGATQQITNIIYSGSFEDGNPLSISVTGSDGISKLYTLTYSASLVTQIIQS